MRSKFYYAVGKKDTRNETNVLYSNEHFLVYYGIFRNTVMDKGWDATNRLLTNKRQRTGIKTHTVHVKNDSDALMNNRKALKAIVGIMSETMSSGNYGIKTYIGIEANIGNGGHKDCPCTIHNKNVNRYRCPLTSVGLYTGNV